MAKYNKTGGVGGQWVDKKELHKAGAALGMSCKIVSETKPMPSSFKDDEGNPTTQDVAKVRFEGYAEEAVNVSLNKPTINALIDAFGDDSVNWQGQPLTAFTMQAIVSGKMGFALYIVPVGYEVSTDEGGYVVIAKKGSKAEENFNAA